MRVAASHASLAPTQAEKVAALQSKWNEDAVKIHLGIDKAPMRFVEPGLQLFDAL